MLGGIGGYPLQGAFNLKSVASGILGVLKFFPYHFLGPLYLLFWFVLVFMGLTGDKRKALMIGAMLGILLVPILQVAGLIDVYHNWARYMLHLSLAIIIATVLRGRVLYMHGGWQRIMAVAILFAVMGAFILRDLDLKKTIIQERLISAAAAHEYVYSGKPYIDAKELAWFYDGLRVIHRYLLDREIPTRIIPEPPFRKYIAGDRLRDIQAKGLLPDQKPDNGLRTGIVNGEVSIAGYLVTWRLGPYREGQYSILMGREAGLYNFVHGVGRKGEQHRGQYLPGNAPDVFFMRIVYQSPGGWEAISNEYRIEIPGNAQIQLQ
jgi:hypothetical protein